LETLSPMSALDIEFPFKGIKKGLTASQVIKDWVSYRQSVLRQITFFRKYREILYRGNVLLGLLSRQPMKPPRSKLFCAKRAKKSAKSRVVWKRPLSVFWFRKKASSLLPFPRRIRLFQRLLLFKTRLWKS